MKINIPKDFFFDLYRDKAHPDLSKTHENTPRFLVDVNSDKNPIISPLFSYPFSGFLRSFKDTDNENKVTLECIYYIFKDTPGTSILKQDKIFGVNNLHEPTVVDLEDFNLFNVNLTDNEGKAVDSIPTPSLFDFYPHLGPDKKKLEVKSLSSLPPVTPETLETLSKDNSIPTPVISPSRIIPIPPEVVLKLDQVDDLTDFEKTLQTVRNCFIDMASLFKNEGSKESFLRSTYPILQLLWIHSCPLENLDPATFKFLHDLPGPFPTTDDEWAEWKVDFLASQVSSSSNASNDPQDDHKPSAKDPDEDSSDLEDAEEQFKKLTIQERLLHRSIKLLEQTMKINNSSPSSSIETKQILKEDFFGYNAFLIAGSMDGSTKASDLHPPLKLVLQKPSRVACSSINNILNTRSGCTMLIDYALSQAVRSLDIFRQNPEALGRFSLMFCVPRKMDELTAAMEEFGINARLEARLANDNLINKISESKPDLAFDAATWHLTMKNFYYFIKFLWSEDAIITKVANELLRIVDENRLSVDSISASNRLFIPKFFWMINNRFHNWLDSCARANDCKEAHWDDIKRLPSVVEDLLRNHSIPSIEMPLPMKKLVNERYEAKFGRPLFAEKRKADDDNLADGGGFPQDRKYKKPKRDRDEDDDDEDRIRDPAKFNENVPKAWKMAPKAFRKVISPNADKAPKLNGKAICLLYHITGKCSRARGCPHSHDPLDDNTKKAVKKFIEECKQAAAANRE